jgi:short-subunit dehydrogenase/acyl carrier protein
MIDARAHEKSDNSPIPDPPSRLIVRIPERTECLPVTQTRPALKLRHDAAYLLVGGLGGLGQAIATYMAECGARHFIFLSRSCGKSDEHVQFFQELESQGCTVTAVAGDVSNPEDVNAMVIQSSRPIAGVLQLAMVLQDRPFLKMSHEDWTTSIKPKVDGTWNLHQALKDRQLDFFVIFGSISGTFGIAHQANYAASNTFQDAFVQYRHSLGLPASVLNIGAMADIGYVSQNQSVQEYFRSAGMPFMSETELLEAMHLSIVQQHQQQQEQPVSSTTVGLGFTSTSQLALGIRATKPMDDPSNRVLWKRDRRVDIYRNIEASRRLQGSAGTTDAAADQDKLDAFINEVKSSPSLLDRPDTLGLLTHEIGVSIYGFMLQPVEDLDVSKSLMTLGVDSLVTIEIKNWLKRRLDVEVSTLEILNGGTIESLGQLAFSRLRKKYGGDVSL